MFKSIFSKYFAVISTIVIVSFLALGVVQVTMASGYWKTEKKEGLSQSAADISEITARQMESSPFSDGYFLNREQMTVVLSTMTRLSNADIILTDANGEILLCSFVESTLVKPGHVLDEEVLGRLQALESGEELYLEGTLGQIFQQRKFSAARTVEKDGKTVGYVLVSATSNELTQYIWENIKIFFMAAVGVLIVAFIASYLLTYRLVRPLREMSAAAKQFGQGDFSHRVRVQGRDEVAQLAQSLNNMAISLSSEETVRRDFVANVSHELKTPMTTIAGFIDGVLDGTVPPERRDEYLKIVSDEVRRLSRLVKAMLDLSRIDSGQLKLSPVTFDLTESVGHALLSFAQSLEEKQISITGLEETEPVMAVGDYDLIGQVVYNLVENAVKFTEPQGEIRFGLRREGDRVYCSVRNTGAGIPASEMPHIFERFYKSDKSRSRDKLGLGLGLFLVRSILTLHRGEIIVRSVEGKYCEFEFWLPAAL